MQHHGSKPVAVRHSHQSRIAQLPVSVLRRRCPRWLEPLSQRHHPGPGSPTWQPPFENNPINEAVKQGSNGLPGSSCLGYIINSELWGTALPPGRSLCGLWCTRLVYLTSIRINGKVDIKRSESNSSLSMQQSLACNQTPVDQWPLQCQSWYKEHQRLVAHHRLVARRRCLVREQREPPRLLLRAARLGV